MWWHPRGTSILRILCLRCPVLLKEQRNEGGNAKSAQTPTWRWLGRRYSSSRVRLVLQWWVLIFYILPTVISCHVWTTKFRDNNTFINSSILNIKEHPYVNIGITRHIKYVSVFSCWFTNDDKLTGLKPSPQMISQVRGSEVWVGQVLSLGSHKVKVKEAAWIGFLSGAWRPLSRSYTLLEEFGPLGVVELRFLLPCWLSTGGHSKLLKAPQHSPPNSSRYSMAECSPKANSLEFWLLLFWPLDLHKNYYRYFLCVASPTRSDCFWLNSKSTD